MTAKAVLLSKLDATVAAEALAYIFDNLRETDLAEIKASTRLRPDRVFAEGIALSRHTWIIQDRTGLPIGVFGVAPSAFPDMGIAWLVGTDGMEREATAIARQTRRYVAAMQQDFSVLTNWIDARNERSLQWLLRAGFHIIDADPAYGPERRLFYQFARTG